MVHREMFECEVGIYFKTKPHARKYDSPENRAAIVEKMMSFGTIPCEVGVLRALTELVNEDVIARADGGSDESDAKAARAEEQARLDRIASEPLTQKDFDVFSRLTLSELEHRYLSDAVFRIRYAKACREWGFKLPTPSKSITSGRVFV